MNKREIKFRAWDGERMVYQGSNSSFNFSSRNWSVTEWLNDEDDKTVTRPSQSFVSLMQFTGLHDKNGKEIYEEDIVLTYGNKPRLIVWDRFAWFLEDPAYDDGVSFTYQEAVREFIDASGKAHEVIGNIYENPELLNKSWYAQPFTSRPKP